MSDKSVSYLVGQIVAKIAVWICASYSIVFAINHLTLLSLPYDFSTVVSAGLIMFLKDIKLIS